MIRSTVRKHRYHGRGVGRPHRWRIGITFCALAFPLAAATPKEPLNYDRDVRPILSENCFPCHGQDSKKRMAGLRLDSFETATADRGGRVALSPGKPEASEIYKRITADKSRRMPPVFS
ncbi:MAG TPA: c-type cytochrome domain-containing protein, partial [Bryobacteraceae bacterium]|nr:c-type cytochrome domain-containing protein [Bryobacteraceae bacterium]